MNSSDLQKQDCFDAIAFEKKILTKVCQATYEKLRFC